MAQQYPQVPPPGQGQYPPSPPPQGWMPAPPPPPKKSRKLLWVGIIVVVIIVIIIIAALASTSSNSVNVTAVNFTSGDNACGTNGHTGSGITLSSGGSAQDTLSITNGNWILSCTINSVSTTTSGFSLSGANTPLTIPAGGTESLSFTVTAPNHSYNGVLTIDLE
jgi:hypothetical protein